MVRSMVLVLALASLSFASSAYAQSPASSNLPAPVDDHHPGLELAVGVGLTGSELFIRGGDLLTFHGHGELFLGHDVATFEHGSRGRVALGYAGSVLVNFGDVLHRHGLGLMIRNGIFNGWLGVGPTLLHGIAGAGNGALIPGGHLSVTIGMSWGAFRLSLPIALDVLVPSSGSVGVMLTAGIAVGITGR